MFLYPQVQTPDKCSLFTENGKAGTRLLSMVQLLKVTQMCIICPAGTGTKICLCLLVFYAAQRIKSAPGCKRQKYD